MILAVLFPVGIWVTRSTPSEMGLLPDGMDADGTAKLPDEGRLRRAEWRRRFAPRISG